MTGYDASLGKTRIRAVSAIIFDSAGRLLVIQRGHEPSKGLWSVPGGKVKPGETDEEALRREIVEETALVVDVGKLAGRVERPGLPGIVYEIFDYDATVVGSDGSSDAGADTGHAGDDADDLRWVTCAEMVALPLTDGLVDVLTAWGRMPR